LVIAIEWVKYFNLVNGFTKVILHFVYLIIVLIFRIVYNRLWIVMDMVLTLLDDGMTEYIIKVFIAF